MSANHYRLRRAVRQGAPRRGRAPLPQRYGSRAAAPRWTKGQKLFAATLLAALAIMFSGPLFAGLRWAAGLGPKSAQAAEGPLMVYLSADAAADPVVSAGVYPVPFKNDGYVYWEGYACRADGCPGRKGNDPALFPALPAKRGGQPVVACPWCAKAGKGGGKPERDCVADLRR